MNMFRYELKSLRKSTIIWICSILTLALLFLSIFPGVASDVEGFKAVMSNYPPAVRAILGIHLDYLGSLIGFYSVFFWFIVLCGAIQAMNLGVSILSKESRERTADFLLVKPVSRTEIINAKLSAALTAIMITNVVFQICAILLANIFKTEDYGVKVFFLINLTLFFMQLIFLAIGLFVSVFFQKIKSILPISLGFVFGFYLVGALISTDPEDKVGRLFSPFQYFNITYIIDNEHYENIYLVVSAIIIAVAVTTTYIIYRRKDIHAVS